MLGLQERWNTSIELFHHMYGSKLFREELAVRRQAEKAGIYLLTYTLTYVHNIYYWFPGHPKYLIKYELQKQLSH
jgi:hypothetical protein